MFKFSSLFSAIPSSTREACRENYKAHGNLVRNATGYWRHVSCYMQNEILDEFGAFAVQPSLLALTELTFADASAFDAAYGEPEYRRVIQPDTPRFADRETPFIGFFEEVDSTTSDVSPAYKVLRFFLPTDPVQGQPAVDISSCGGDLRSSGGFRRNRLIRAPNADNKPLYRYDEYWTDSMAEAARLFEQLAASRPQMSEGGLRIVDVVARTRLVS